MSESVPNTNDHLVCSPNYGPLLVIDYITAPNIQGYQNWTLIWELPIYGIPILWRYADIQGILTGLHITWGGYRATP